MTKNNTSLTSYNRRIVFYIISCKSHMTFHRLLPSTFPHPFPPLLSITSLLFPFLSSFPPLSCLIFSLLFKSYLILCCLILSYYILFFNLFSSLFRLFLYSRFDSVFIQWPAECPASWMYFSLKPVRTVRGTIHHNQDTAELFSCLLKKITSSYFLRQWKYYSIDKNVIHLLRLYNDYFKIKNTFNSLINIIPMLF